MFPPTPPKLRILDLWQSRHHAAIDERTAKRIKVIMFIVDNPTIPLAALDLSQMILEGAAIGVLPTAALADLCQVIDEVLLCPDAAQN
jgi:hypothetical protein